jgi:hypothetical protein
MGLTRSKPPLCAPQTAKLASKCLFIGIDRKSSAPLKTALLTQLKRQRCDRAANKKVQLSPSLPLIFLALEIPRRAVAYWFV